MREIEPRTCHICGLGWTGRSSDPCPSSRCAGNRATMHAYFGIGDPPVAVCKPPPGMTEADLRARLAAMQASAPPLKLEPAMGARSSVLRELLAISAPDLLPDPVFQFRIPSGMTEDQAQAEIARIASDRVRVLEAVLRDLLAVKALDGRQHMTAGDQAALAVARAALAGVLASDPAPEPPIVALARAWADSEHAVVQARSAHARRPFGSGDEAIVERSRLAAAQERANDVEEHALGALLDAARGLR